MGRRSALVEARSGGATSFGLGPALLVAKYVHYAEEELSGDRRGGRLRLVEAGMRPDAP